MAAKPAVVQATAPTPGIVSTYAGGATTGYATSIDQGPDGLAVSGTILYVSDPTHARIWAIDTTTGVETPYAGTGLVGGSGDGGPALNATLATPQGLALDAAGDLYLATTDRIRMITPGGIISTVAGGGAGCTLPCSATTASLAGPSAVSVDGAGELFIADRSAGKIFKVSAGIMSKVAGTDLAPGFSGDGGPATSATLWGPQGVVADGAGDIWIADTGNSRIRKVDHVTGIITTVAGGATSGTPCANGPATSPLYLPEAVSLDAAGNVLITDSYDQCIRLLSGSTLTTVAGAGVAGSLGQPSDAVVNASGAIFIADPYGPNPAVQEVNGTTMTRVAGSDGTHCAVYGLHGPASGSMLCRPQYIGFDHQGNLYISDNLAQMVLKVDASGVLTAVAGSGTQGFAGDGGPATAAELHGPSGIAFDSAGNLFIADSGNLRIRRVDHVTGDISTVAGNGTQGFLGDGGPAINAEFGDPLGLAFDSHDNLYVADLNNYRIRKVDGAGNISTFAGCGGPSTCEVGSPTSGPATSVYLNGVFNVATDSADNLYITQTGSLVRVDPQDDLTPLSPRTNSEFGVAIGPQNRVVATSGGQASLYPASGPAITLAGVSQGASGTVGDGSPALSTSFDTLYGVAIDASSDIFLAETFNRRVRRIQAYTAPAAPTGVAGVAGNHGVSLHWTRPADDGGLPVMRYTITPYTGGTPRVATVVTGSPAQVTQLVNGAAYTFTVSAFNGWAAGPPSSPSPPVTPVVTAPGQITTIAGAPGTGAPLSIGQDIFSVTADFGDVFLGDFSNPVVRKLDSSSQESVVAGNDGFGYSGDGGPATAASIAGAGAMADCNGTVYVADTYNYVIRVFTPGGQISTIAGTGVPGYSGDGGFGTDAQIGRVFGIACRTGGGIYIADSDNGAIRILNPTNIIQTFWYGFSFPTGIVELAGLTDTVAVSDDGSDNAVWLLTDTQAGVIAGTPGHPGNSGDGGLAYLSALNDPQGLAQFGCCGSSFSLYIADRGNNRIREVDSTTDLITAFAGSGIPGYLDGSGTTARFNSPAGVAIGGLDGLTMYISDTGNHRVRVTSIGAGPRSVGTIAGNGTLSLAGDNGPATAAQLGVPYAVSFDPAGNMYIADNADDVIRKIDVNGTITTVAGDGRPGFSGDGGQAVNAQLSDPRGVAVDSLGDIFITDTGNQRIREVDASGVIKTVAGTGLAGYSGDGGTATGARINYPRAVAVDGAGDVYIADTANNRVRKFTPGGTISTVAGNGVAGFSGDGVAVGVSLNLPRGLAIDGSGNVFIADSGNNRVRKLAAGHISTVAGDGTPGFAGDGGSGTSAELNSPFGLALDGAGNLYIADTGNQRVRVVDAQGAIRTVVSNCGTQRGFGGDGGPAMLARLNYPFGLAADPAGDVYVADASNNRVRAGFDLVLVTPRQLMCQAPPAPPVPRSSTSPSPTAVDRSIQGSAGTVAVPLAGHVTTAPSRAAHRLDWRTARGGGASSHLIAKPASSGATAAPTVAVAQPVTQAAQTAHVERSYAKPAATQDVLGYASLLASLGFVALIAGRHRRRRNDL